MDSPATVLGPRSAPSRPRSAGTIEDLNQPPPEWPIYVPTDWHKNTITSESSTRRSSNPDQKSSSLSLSPTKTPADTNTTSSDFWIGEQGSRAGEEFEMSTLQISQFSGEEDSVDSTTFVRQVRNAWLRNKTLFTGEYADIEYSQARAADLAGHLAAGSPAWKWYQGLDESILDDFDRLADALQKRFPRRQKTSERRFAYRDLGLLSQGQMSVPSYLEKVRDIQRRLPSNDPQLENDLMNAMIDGLTDAQLRTVVGAMVARERNVTFETAIDILKGAARIDGEVEPERDAVSSYKTDPTLNARDKAFCQVLESISQSFATLSLNGAGGTRQPQSRPPPQSYPTYPARNISGTGLDPARESNQGVQNGGYQQGQGARPVGRNFDLKSVNWMVNGKLSNVCFRCGEVNTHIATTCGNPPLPQETQNAIRSEWTRRRDVLRNQQGNGGVGFTNFSNQNNPLGNPGFGRMATASLAQTLPDYNAYNGLGNPTMEGEDWVRPVIPSGNGHNPIPECNFQEVIWNGGDEVNFSDVLALEHKRTADDAGLEDAVTLQEGSAVQREGVSRAEPSRAAERPAKRSLVGLKGERLPEVSEILNAPLIKCSILQLASMNAELKAQVLKSFKLTPAEGSKNGRRSTKKKSATAPGGKRVRIGSAEVCASAVDGLTRTEAGPSEIRRKMPGIVPNFYTTAVVTPSDGKNEHALDRVLLDGGAMVNLIPEWVVRKTQLKLIPDQSLSVRGYDGRTSSLPGYVRLKITIAGISSSLLAYVLPDVRTSYTLLLSRGWMNAAKVIGLYGRDEYWIPDPATGMHVMIAKRKDDGAHSSTKSVDVCLNKNMRPSEEAIQVLKSSAKSTRVRDLLDRIAKGEYLEGMENLMDDYIDDLMGERDDDEWSTENEDGDDSELSEEEDGPIVDVDAATATTLDAATFTPQTTQAARPSFSTVSVKARHH